MRDILVHGNDLIVATHGRGFWILDDISPLRQVTSNAADVALFQPAEAIRVRRSLNPDTPVPPDEPMAENPPDGAIINYWLKTAAKGELALMVYDEKGREVARFSSEAQQVSHLPANVPSYWFAPSPVLPKAAGVNRFVWDLRYSTPASLPYSYYGELLEYSEYTLADHAIVGNTPRDQPRGPLVPPGKYTIELRYEGHTLRQPLTIELDPRIHATAEDLVEQRDLALEIVHGMKSSYDSYERVAALSKEVADHRQAIDRSDAKAAGDELDKQIERLEKGTKSSPGFGPVNRDLARLLFSVENADMRPPQTVRAAVEQSCQALDQDLQLWQQLNGQALKSINQVLAKTKTTELPMESRELAGCKQ
jgi:hypothetical protein